MPRLGRLLRIVLEHKRDIYAIQPYKGNAQVIRRLIRPHLAYNDSVITGLRSNELDHFVIVIPTQRTHIGDVLIVGIFDTKIQIGVQPIETIIVAWGIGVRPSSDCNPNEVASISMKSALQVRANGKVAIVNIVAPPTWYLACCRGLCLQLGHSVG